MSDVGYSQRWMSDILLNANASDILCPVTIWDMKVKVHAMVIRQIHIKSIRKGLSMLSLL